jgi:type I restriction enzyme S subunit
VSGWKTTTVSALGRVVTGKTPPTTRLELFGKDYPFITPTDIVEGQRFIATERFLSDSGKSFQRNLLLPTRAVCFVCIGATIGKMCMTNRPSFTNQQVNSVIVNEGENDPFFVFYLLRHHTAQIKAQAGGAATPIINKTAFSNIEVRVPFLHVQRKIAGLLCAYDDLIENNARRIRLLKELAKTILRGAHEHEPDAWMLLPIGEVYEELFDGPHATPKPSTAGPIYLGIKNVTEQGELDLTEIRHIAEEEFQLWTRRVLPRPGDIVFTYEATLNRYGIINRDFRGCLGRRMALIRVNEKRIDPYLLLHCLLSDQWRDEVRSKITSGSTVDRIPLTTFPTFHLRVPGPEIKARITPPIRACEELAENCRRRNDLLRKTRDLLLPKLISGEVPVEAADEAAAELMELTA